MPSRVTVFDQNGTPIAELNTTTVRSWVLDDIGRCTFPLATFTDPNCRRDVLQYGNFILVEHLPTLDAAGNVRGTLPSWIGIILPPQQWNYGKLIVTAFSAEAFMSARPMPYTQDIGTAGSIFQDMIYYANQINGFPFQLGVLHGASPSQTVNLRLSMYEEAKQLAKNVNQDFDVTFSRGAGGQMVLLANWYFQKGVTVDGVFSEGYLGNMRLPKLTEQGTISNRIQGYSSASSSGARFSSLALDQGSIGDYGVLGTNQVFSVSDQAGTDAATQSFLAKNRRPQITLELTALDSGNTFGGLAVGNVWNVVLNSVGFYSGNIGFQGSVRLTGVEYDDWTNEARLTTQVLTSDLTRANYA